MRDHQDYHNARRAASDAHAPICATCFYECTQLPIDEAFGITDGDPAGAATEGQ
jgi:hypothetical protein